MFKKLLFITILTFIVCDHAVAATEYWVNTDRLERRTCPNSTCGVVGHLFFRSKVVALEEKDGWVRITEFYNASCRKGISEYVDKGIRSCTLDNGIINGKFAEWVNKSSLVNTKPEDPAKDAVGNYTLVKESDDYRIYKDIFAKKAAELIDEGKCTEADFEEMGGWMKSTNYWEQPIYFVYCGGMTLSNKLHLNAKTGEVFK